MKSIKVSGKIRTDIGKKATRTLRSEDRVPGIIYGGTETISFSAAAFDLRNLVYTAEFQVAEIEVEGKTYRTILKDLQFDVVTDTLSHVDFLELVDDKKVIADLPLKFTGQPEGVKAGGRLIIKAKTLKVRAFPKDLLENIEVDINSLQLNENVRVEDIKVTNMEVLNSPRIPVASIVMTRALKQAENEEAKKK